jgi:hypothetical protein
VDNYTYFVSPDGQSFLGLDSERNSVAYSVQSGQGKPVPGLNPAEQAALERTQPTRPGWDQLHPHAPHLWRRQRLKRTTTIASYRTSIWSMA